MFVNKARFVAPKLGEETLKKYIHKKRSRELTTKKVLTFMFTPGAGRGASPTGQKMSKKGEKKTRTYEKTRKNALVLGPIQEKQKIKQR